MREHIPKLWCMLVRTRPMWGMIPLRVVFGVTLILQGIGRFVFFRQHETSLLSGLPNEWSFLVLVIFSVIEILGGLMIIPGLFARIVGFAIAIEMFLAVFLEQIPLDYSRDLQTQIILACIASMMIFSGAGRYSIDHKLAIAHLKKHPNKKWELYTLAETPLAKWWE